MTGIRCCASGDGVQAARMSSLVSLRVRRGEVRLVVMAWATDRTKNGGVSLTWMTRWGKGVEEIRIRSRRWGG